VRRMQEELFSALSAAESRKALREIEPQARGISRRYLEGLERADVRALAIHRRISRLNHTRRCAEAAAVEACRRSGLRPAPGMEIGYVVKDAGRWAVDPEDQASEFDCGYYVRLLQKAWEEVAFVWHSGIKR
jgi:DNA polymerase elongation subunit (family B)